MIHRLEDEVQPRVRVTEGEAQVELSGVLVDVARGRLEYELERRLPAWPRDRDPTFRRPRKEQDYIRPNEIDLEAS